MNIENWFWLKFPEGSLDIVDDIKDDLVVALSRADEGLWVRFPEESFVSSSNSTGNNELFRSLLSWHFF